MDDCPIIVGLVLQWPSELCVSGTLVWGDFSVQCTFGQTLPFTNSRKVGDPFALNVAFQYHIFKFLWPEFEVSYTHWP